MPLYQEAFGIPYVLRTMDIDFAVKFAPSGGAEKVDLEKVLTNLGYVPVVMRSGIRRFTRENFTVEFEKTWYRRKSISPVNIRWRK